MANFFKLFLLCSTLSLIIVSCGKKQSPDEPYPIFHENAIYVPTDNGKVIVYNPETGARKYEINITGNCVGAPVVANDYLYIGTDQKKLYRVDLYTHKIVWEKTTNAPIIGALATNGTVVYVPTNNLICYDSTGTVVWTYTGGAQPASGPQYVAANATILTNRIYIAIDDKVHCVQDNGTAIWQSAPATAPIVSAVNVSEDFVYYGSDDNKIYKINASNGTAVWNYITSDDVKSSPVVYGGMCIAGNDDNYIYDVDVPSGLLRWKFKTESLVRSSPTVHAASNTILVGSNDYNLYALDHINGTLKWKYAAASLIVSSPVIQGNNVYFSSFDKYLYSVDARLGTLNWKRSIDFHATGSTVIDIDSTQYYSGNSGMSIY